MLIPSMQRIVNWPLGRANGSCRHYDIDWDPSKEDDAKTTISSGVAIDTTALNLATTTKLAKPSILGQASLTLMMMMMMTMIALVVLDNRVDSEVAIAE